MRSEKASIIHDVCSFLSEENVAAARQTAERYSFDLRNRVKRKFNPHESVRIFNRDGFIDRYTGSKLVFPGTLQVLGIVLPEHFPWHPHGNLTKSHIVHWELYPTVDHIFPISRGGPDVDSNWATTSMLANQAKLHWTLDELGWTLHEPGDLHNWDGLTDWFFSVCRTTPGCTFTARHQKMVSGCKFSAWCCLTLQCTN